MMAEFHGVDGCECTTCCKARLVDAENEIARLRAELAALRGPDYVIVPRTILLELGDKMAAMEAAIGLPTDIEDVEG